MSSRGIGLVLVGLGALAIGLGLLAMAGGLSWFGRLPGDIRIETGDVRVYIPITSMVLLSVALSVLVYVVQRFFSG